MSLKPLEFFVFFILPFIAAGVLRRVYLDASKLVQYLVFGGLGAFLLWLFWDSPTAEVRMGVLAMIAIVGIPTLLIALMWPWLVRIVMLPYRLFNRFFVTSKADADSTKN
ncbi:MAG: hypothetical protein WCL27_04845 [Betaproteobacteria bacterium]